MGYSNLVLLLVTCYATIACQNNSNYSAFEYRMRVIEDSLNKANAEISHLKNSIQVLARDNETEDIFDELQKIAYLEPGDNGYSTVKSDIGILTVSLEDVNPYANGSKVTLQWGNTTGATITGLKMKLDWGGVNEDGSPINSEARGREFTLNESLVGGTWSNIEVVLQGIRPKDLGFIRIKEVRHTGIRLASQ